MTIKFKCFHCAEVNTCDTTKDAIGTDLVEGAGSTSGKLRFHIACGKCGQENTIVKEATNGR